MLAIRLQRTGRKGHAMFRVVVQDSHVTPSSGKVVAALGSYDPHTKTATIVKDKASFYLEHGAQPSPRVVRLFEQESIALPAWVLKAAEKQGKLRNPEKLRRNQPKEEPVAEAEPETTAEEPAAETTEEA
ncbi:MAG: rpsP [Candidatus Saccharibacteria bacterium]|nr:rpsP [Candidatus Saccharibacteria bacterium]